MTYPWNNEPKAEQFVHLEPDVEVFEKEDEPDMVNHPPHYTFGTFEVIDVLLDWFPDDPLLWQVGKYIARAPHKGDYLENLLKAQFYLNKRIEICQKSGH